MEHSQENFPLLPLIIFLLKKKIKKYTTPVKSATSPEMFQFGWKSLSPQETFPSGFSWLAARPRPTAAGLGLSPGLGKTPPRPALGACLQFVRFFSCKRGLFSLLTPVEVAGCELPENCSPLSSHQGSSELPGGSPVIQNTRRGVFWPPKPSRYILVGFHIHKKFKGCFPRRIHVSQM